MSPKFKKFLSVSWRATMRGCTLAIGILVLFFAIMSIITAASGKSEQGMTFSSMMTLILFALVISYAKEFFNASSLPAPAQWALNFFVIGIAYFFVILRSGTIASTSGAFYVTGTVIYILFYLIVMGITLLIKRITSKKETEKDEPAEYTSRFV